ncbi:RHS repeat domain-containing protein [Parapedobacter sp. DT-150]|uniref:RHS repeat domain-containing protein n=1 Tax=Parapedobacter sp. DT-150 TaxID=3396162 RepID=UPI003F1AF132
MEREHSSDGKVLTKRYKYPFDYAEITGTDNISKGIKRLLDSNMISRTIEERKLVAANEGAAEKLIVADFLAYYPTVSLPSTRYGFDVLTPSSTSNPSMVQNGTVVLNSGYKPLINYDTYDAKGNPLQVTETGGPSTSYLWSYNGQYPIAAVTNAVQGDIAYAGFESDGKGNWSYSGATAADATAPTGKRVYSLGGGALSKSGLSTGKTYLLTYWAKSTTATGISGGTAAVMRTRNGWTQYRRVVTGVSSVTVSGTVAIDDVRLHPAEAQMETFTYDPLVGMTSRTDAPGNTFYYVYDGFGRLTEVRDLAGNRVEDYRYNYRTN